MQTQVVEMERKWWLGAVLLVLGGGVLLWSTTSGAPEPIQPTPSVSMSPAEAAGGIEPEPESEPEPNAASFVWHRPSAQSTPTPSAEAFDVLDEPFEAYLDQWGLRIDPETGRAAQDMKLRAAMQAKTDALSELSAQYHEIADSGDEYWARNAQVRIGDLREEMAVWLELLPYPSYLNEEQYEIYDRATQAMAIEHRTAAAEAYDAALADLPEDDVLFPILTERLADVGE